MIPQTIKRLIRPHITQNIEPVITFLDTPGETYDREVANVHISGWTVGMEPINEVFLRSTASGKKIPFVETVREDVREKLPHPHVKGFYRVVSVFELSESEQWEIISVVGGKEHVHPLIISFPKAHTDTLFDQKRRKLDKLRTILRCPNSKQSLTFNGKAAHADARQYPLNEYQYNFLSSDFYDVPGEVPPAISSFDEASIALFEKYADGLVLDNGCGARNLYFENVVNFDICDYFTTDVVGTGDALPFADNSFDAVISNAVLEHVRDPFACVKEIARVLKPGGEIYATVPLLAPFHGYPSHYYNMTTSGLRNLFEGEFDIQDIDVFSWGRPIWALTWIVREYVSGLPADVAADFKKMTVEQLVGDPALYREEAFVTELSKEIEERIACVNYIHAIKKS